MVINAYGVLSDHLNRVLLQKATNSETLIPPGNELKPGELPAASLAATFRQETGLIVLPLRLTGVYFRPDEIDSLHLCFRCLMRGGTLVTPAGEPEAGFFDSQPLPQSLALIYQQPVSQALYHTGGRPHWEQQAVPFGTRLREWLAGKGAEQPANSWQVHVTVITRNASGQVLWVKKGEDEQWQLPTAERQQREAPWETARRVLRDVLDNERPLANLPLLCVGKDKWQLTFVFTADGKVATLSSKREPAYFYPGEEPDTCHPSHIAQVAKIIKPDTETRFILE